MKITFNNAKKGANEIEIESFSEQDNELWIYLYTDDYNAVKSLVYGACRSDMTLDRGNASLSFMNYTDITNFSSVVDEFGRDYITIEFRQVANTEPKTPEEIKAEIKRLQALLEEEK